MTIAADAANARAIRATGFAPIRFTAPPCHSCRRSYPAVLVRIPELARLDSDENGDLVAEAWLTRAQKRVAKAWLDEHSSA